MILPLTPQYQLNTPVIKFADLRPETLIPVVQSQFPDRTEAAHEANAASERRRDAEKAEAERQAQLATQAAYVPPAPSPQPTGDCASWMAEAGITDTASAIILINKESGCNPNAVNPSSGACGIGQQLPCGKWPHTWNDPVGSLIDMNAYVMERYGSWANALNFHLSNNWY